MKSRTSTGNVMKSTQAVQMGGGVNPNWWSIRPAPPATTITSYEQQQHHHHPPYNLFLHQPPNNNNFLPSYNPPNSIILSPYSPQPTSSSNSSSWHEHDNHQQQQDHHQQLPSETWSQLLLDGMDQEEGEKQSAATTAALTHQQFQRAANKLKMHNWDQSPVMLQQQHLHDLNYESSTSIMDIKKEHHQSVPSSCYNMFGHGNHEEFLQAAKTTTAAWSSINVMMSNNSSPPKSCVTSFGNNNNSMLNFSSNSKGDNGIRHPAPVDHPSESNSSGTGGASKKARVQPSPPQSNTFKVRKEKLGDRITALHQLVSPFGKTDTASVLLETMGYIRFLQSQIEALSLPYLASGLGSTRQHQQQPLMHAQSESICIFPEDPGQESSEKEPEKDLRSRGLCLVPLSCTLQVGSDNGADYWASPPAAAFGGGFR